MNFAQKVQKLKELRLTGHFNEIEPILEHIQINLNQVEENLLMLQTDRDEVKITVIP